MLKYTNLNPFNHGTATITYIPAEEKVQDDLSVVLREGWGWEGKNVWQLSSGAEKNSNNFRVETNQGIILMKRSRNNAYEKQELVNQIISFLYQEGIKVPKILPTKEGKTFYAGGYVAGKDIYCVHEFLESENFDGSQQELISAAQEIGRLHKAMSIASPFIEAIRLKQYNADVFKHNALLLKEVVAAIKEKNVIKDSYQLNVNGTVVSMGDYVTSIIPEIEATAKIISEVEITRLPFQMIHYDLHPHNILFDVRTKELRALIDFDSMRYSQKARDVGFAMHRLARTYGENTERKNDAGIDIRVRAGKFLEAYLEENPLLSEEIKLLPLIIQDEALDRVISVLSNHYLKNDTVWSFDLPKQMTTLQEGKLFSGENGY